MACTPAEAVLVVDCIRVEIAEDMTVVECTHLCIPEVVLVDHVDMTAVECRHLYILETVAEDTDLVSESDSVHLLT